MIVQCESKVPDVLQSAFHTRCLGHWTCCTDGKALTTLAGFRVDTVTPRALTVATFLNTHRCRTGSALTAFPESLTGRSIVVLSLHCSGSMSHLLPLAVVLSLVAPLSLSSPPPPPPSVTVHTSD